MQANNFYSTKYTLVDYAFFKSEERTKNLTLLSEFMSLQPVNLARPRWPSHVQRHFYYYLSEYHWSRTIGTSVLIHKLGK